MQIQDDTVDGIGTSVSSARLRRSFKFDAVWNQQSIDSWQLYPTGPYILVDCGCPALLIENFQHLTVVKLLFICLNHRLSFSMHSKRNAIIESLQNHVCQSDGSILKIDLLEFPT